MLMDLLKQTLRTDRTVDERRALEGDFLKSRAVTRLVRTSPRTMMTMMALA